MEATRLNAAGMVRAAIAEEKRRKQVVVSVLIVLAFCLLLGGVAAYGQQKPKAVPVAVPVPPPVTAALVQAAADANLPNMSELQQAQLDRDLAKIDAAQSRAQAQAQSESLQWADDAQRIINDVQKVNPDFVWHVSQGQGDRTGWARKPKPAQPPMPPMPTTVPVMPQAPPAAAPATPPAVKK